MNRKARFAFWLPVLAVVLLGQPASAQYGVIAGVLPRREVHEDLGDFRFTGELYANPDDREPYWGYLAVSKELLMVPNVGHAEFGLVLATADGKPVQEARWTEDHTLDYEEWSPMSLANGRWHLRYRSEQVRPGPKTVFFGGKIKGGKRSYTKLWLIVDVTIGGRRKDARQAEALQFLVYRFDAGRGRVDPMLLINAQERMGAGGKPLIGPAVEEPTDNGQSGDSAPPAVRPTTDDRYASQPTNQVALSGFNGRVRLTGDNNRTVEYDVAGSQTVVLPEGAKSFWLDVLHEGRVWIRVKHNGRNQPFPAGTARLAIARDR